MEEIVLPTFRKVEIGKLRNSDTVERYSWCWVLPAVQPEEVARRNVAAMTLKCHLRFRQVVHILTGSTTTIYRKLCETCGTSVLNARLLTDLGGDGRGLDLCQVGAKLLVDDSQVLLQALVVVLDQAPRQLLRPQEGLTVQL